MNSRSRNCESEGQKFAIVAILLFPCLSHDKSRGTINRQLVSDIFPCMSLFTIPQVMTNGLRPLMLVSETPTRSILSLLGVAFGRVVQRCQGQ